MSKIIFKFWIINFLISIVLFVIYRVVIAETKSTDTNPLGTFLSILNILLNLGFSALYFMAMVIGSLTFFLNLAGKIRNNFFLSFLSFLGFPLICIIYLLIHALTDLHAYQKSVLTTLVIFSIVYLFVMAIEFLLFRRKTKNFRMG